MQIRLTVLGPDVGPAGSPHGPVPGADVLVTAPAGTTLGAVARALAGAVGPRAGARGRGSTATHVHLYFGEQRLDERAVLGRPPLLDGAVLRLDEPDPDHAVPPQHFLAHAAPAASPDAAPVAAPAAPPAAPAALHVIGGPDSGGVHLLHPGRVTVGRSADADVPVDDPDVSRFHLTLDVGPDGSVQVLDAGSTNGTVLDGAVLGPEPRAARPGSLIALGESLLRVAPGRATAEPRAETLPDGQGAAQLTLRPLIPAQPLGRTASGTGSARDPRRAAVGDGAGGFGASAFGPGGGPGAAGSTALGALGPRGGADVQGGGEERRGLGRGLLGRRRGQDTLVAAMPPRPTGGPHGTGPDEPGGGSRWPDPADLLLTVLGPGPRLWERGPDHPDALTVRLGSHAGRPVTADLRSAGSLGLAGPRARLLGLARSVLAQLAVAHPPSTLELVLVAADPGRTPDERIEAWSWLPWLPHLRPGHGQPCRLLTAFDPAQSRARLEELLPSSPYRVSAAAATVVVVDGDPGDGAARAALAGLLAHGPARGVHVLALAGHPDRLPPGCGATAAITGEVGTQLDVERPLAAAPAVSGHQHRAAPERELVAGVALDAVSAGWAGRLARALAPLREPDAHRRAGRGALPDTARLLDLLDLGQVTPARISERWADYGSGTVPRAVVGVDRDGPCALDLTDHLLVGGAPGAGRTELLRSLAAGLSAAERPDRLAILLVEGRPPQDPAQGLAPAVELPHVVGHLTAGDPAALAAAGQSLRAELDRREDLLGDRSFSSWHAERVLSRLAPPRRSDAYAYAAGTAANSGAGGAGEAGGAGTLPHLVVVVDDWDALLPHAAFARALEDAAVRGPRLGVRLALSTAHPERLAGSVLDDALGLRLALRTDDHRAAALLLQTEDPAALDDLPGRGWLRHPDGGVTLFQAARITGRIPRTATLRPTVVPLDWSSMGDAPAPRPVRELGNGPTDLALLASALLRASETLTAATTA